jgi:aspartyl-tRNA(Asn)/glutamyl-tRNA(Gln) amidotransferase subunit C
MSFTGADVNRVARLARLRLTPSEQELFARQLADIVAYARQVSDVDTSHVPAPEASLALPLREDDVEPSIPRGEVLEAAPDAAAGLIKVPRVLG